MNKKAKPIFLNEGLNKSGKKNKLTLQFPTNIDFQNKEVALGYLGMYYSWRNVTGVYRSSDNKEGYNNNRFSYTWVNGVTYEVLLPDGFYTISDLASFMQKNVMIPNGHFMLDAKGKNVYFIDFVLNSTYYAVTMTCSPIAIPVGGSNPNALPLGKVPQLNIPVNNNFGKLIGFNGGSYPALPNTTTIYYINSQNVPKISTANTIYVQCNLAESDTGIFTNAIYQFSPTVPYNQYISITPANLIFSDVTSGSKRNVDIWFTDQNGDPLDVIDPEINVTLLIRDV